MHPPPLPPPPPPQPPPAHTSSKTSLDFSPRQFVGEKNNNTGISNIQQRLYYLLKHTKSNQFFFHDRASAVTNKSDEGLGMKLIVSHFNLVGPSFSSPLLSPGQDRRGKASGLLRPKNNRPCLCNVRRVEIFLRHSQGSLAAAKIIHNLWELNTFTEFIIFKERVLYPVAVLAANRILGASMHAVCSRWKLCVFLCYGWPR